MKDYKPDLDSTVSITLSKAAALVLFEYLHRAEDEERENRPRPQPDQAELRVLWDLSCDPETILVEPFAPNYVEIIADGKKRLTSS